MKNHCMYKPLNKIFCYLAAIVLLAVSLYAPAQIRAEEGVSAGKATIDTIIPPGLQDAFDIQVRNLNFALLQNPADSDINHNNHLHIAHYTLENDLRPDIKLSLPHLEITCKPRFELRWQHWREGIDAGDSENENETFIYEWQTQISLFDKIYLSYGREDLQWGPSFLLSPSNPFYTGNGRDYPKQEVDGADYAKFIWAPNQNWTVSLIANIDEGRRDLFYEFKKTYAAKIDYMTDNGFFSLNLAKQEAGETRLGGFCSWNINDASLVYVESSVSRNEVESLLGISYTTTGGSNFHLEYFYNGGGTREQSLLMYLLSLDSEANRESLGRKNYLFAQYYDHDIMDTWSILLRGTYGLDDDSATLLAYSDYNIGDHTQLFASGIIYAGNGSSEFGTLYDYTMMLGVELSF